MCNATGQPQPQVTWSRSEGSLPELRAIIDDAELTILNVSLNDSGLYICTATNSVGSNSAVFELTVMRASESIKGPRTNQQPGSLLRPQSTQKPETTQELDTTQGPQTIQRQATSQATQTTLGLQTTQATQTTSALLVQATQGTQITLGLQTTQGKQTSNTSKATQMAINTLRPNTISRTQDSQGPQITHMTNTTKWSSEGHSWAKHNPADTELLRIMQRSEGKYQ